MRTGDRSVRRLRSCRTASPRTTRPPTIKRDADRIRRDRSPIQVTPMVKVTIPNAQTAVPTTYGRSGVLGRGRSGRRRRASQIAMAHAAIHAMNAGAKTPGMSCRRIGAAPPAAPIRPVGQADRRCPGDAVVGGGDQRERDRDHERGRGMANEPADPEQRTIRRHQADEAGHELHDEAAKDDRSSPRQVADRAAQEQESRAHHRTEDDQGFDGRMLTDEGLDVRQGRAEHPRVHRRGDERDRPDEQRLARGPIVEHIREDRRQRWAPHDAMLAVAGRPVGPPRSVRGGPRERRPRRSGPGCGRRPWRRTWPGRSVRTTRRRSVPGWRRQGGSRRCSP